MMLIRLAALAAHRLVMARDEFFAEYRRLARLPGDDGEPGPVQAELSCTGVHIERAAGWDHDTQPPVRAGFGFTRPGAPSRLRDNNPRD